MHCLGTPRASSFVPSLLGCCVPPRHHTAGFVRYYLLRCQGRDASYHHAWVVDTVPEVEVHSHVGADADYEGGAGAGVAGDSTMRQDNRPPRAPHNSPKCRT